MKYHLTQRTLHIALASGLVAAFAGCQTAPMTQAPSSETTLTTPKTTAAKPATANQTGELPAAVPGAVAALNNTPGNDATVVRSPIVVPDDVKGAYPTQEVATVSGSVHDQFGVAAIGVAVKGALETVKTDSQGNYTIHVNSGPDVWLRYADNSTSYVFADEHLPVFPNEEIQKDVDLLALDTKVTHVTAGSAATVTSSSLATVLADTSSQRRNFRLGFSLLDATAAANNTNGTTVGADLAAQGLAAVQLTIPQGALVGDADVRLTWLNPLPAPNKPNGDLYGPLQTYTDWDPSKQAGKASASIVPLAPVNFADINLGPNASIAPGSELTIKWVVGPEVLSKYPVQMQGGQALLPCYTYDNAAQTWAIPVLARVFEENGYTWAEYKMRNSTPPQVQS